MMSSKFYITTPIYYANGAPHIGHAYTSLIGDVISRMKRMIGYEVKFATGTDENGQKMKQSAEAVGKEVMEFLDEVATQHRITWDTLNISYTDFIRTTDSKHHAFVQEMLQKTYNTGDIYQGEYEGLYCVGCEGFKKDSDLIEKDGKRVCPDHLKEPDAIKEKNRFFKLNSYESWLKEFYEKKTDFCVPAYRFNEIKSFVDQWLEDFSISREGSDFGVQLPFDTDSVTYIWFDALYNYFTVCVFPHNFTKDGKSVSGEKDDMSFWEEGEVVHLLGKDIGRFHAIFRPAMLKSSGNLPKLDTWKELIHGYFTVDGQKMSKSLGNVIDPVELVVEHGRDALVYYLFSDIKLGNDGDFSWERFHATRENVLKKGWGNLVARVCKMAQKNDIEESRLQTTDYRRLFEVAENEWLGENKLRGMFVDGFDGGVIDGYVKDFDLVGYLRDWYQLVQLGNKYVDETKPWVSAKEDPEQAKQDLQVLLWLIKNIWLLSAPFLLEWYKNFTHILQIDRLLWKTFGTNVSSNDLQELFDMQEFGVSFGEGYLY